ncbi:hypothetical protein [Pelagicoccus mobilis]|uniref:GH16 domain-containing protein n=1 Tax=Pelagicoccus mobilis TaxID=415221 RepID=A0A934S1V8_9BACT|nr:hypothetical protein [Pelagicoccus mobilis]MBK1879091.1 hypothetical protein [Pelagicoccus mobilis]
MNPRVLLILLASATISQVAIAEQRVLIEDALISGTVGILGNGAHSADGFKPTSKDGHIRYEPRYWPAWASLEFEVKGMQSDTGNEDWDHAFLGIYDARGVEVEPAQYWGNFRENYYRFNLHWRGDRRLIKCVIISAEDTEERRSAPIAYHGGDDSRDWYNEPNGQAVDWDPDKWYRFRIVWKPTEVRVTVDNKEIWKSSIPETNPYLPVEPRIWLGSAPRNGNKYANHFENIVYRNFKLTDMQYEAHGFDLWTEEQGLSGTDAEVGADPDGNQLTNLTEFALGIEHGSHDRTNLPRMRSSENGGYELSFVKGQEDTVVAYELVSTTDLESGDWTVISSTLAVDGDRMKLLFSQDRETRFYRLRYKLK